MSISALLFIVVVAVGTITGCAKKDRSQGEAQQPGDSASGELEAMAQRPTAWGGHAADRLPQWPDISLGTQPRQLSLGAITEKINAQMATWPLRTVVSVPRSIQDRMVTLEDMRLPFWAMMAQVAAAAEVGLSQGTPDGYRTWRITFDPDYILTPGYHASGPVLIGLMRDAPAQDAGGEPEMVGGAYTLAPDGRRWLLLVAGHPRQAVLPVSPIVAWSSDDDRRPRLGPLDQFPGLREPYVLPDPPPESDTRSLQVRLLLDMRYDPVSLELPLETGVYSTPHPQLSVVVTQVEKSQQETTATMELEWPLGCDEETRQRYLSALFSTSSERPVYATAGILGGLSEKIDAYRVIDVTAQGAGQEMRLLSIEKFVRRTGMCGVSARWKDAEHVSKVHVVVSQQRYVSLDVSLTGRPEE
jgi:hypothetical protein